MVGRLVGRRAAGFVRYAHAVRSLRSFVTTVRNRTYVCLLSSVFSSLLPSVSSLLFIYNADRRVESNESKPRQCRRKNPEIVPFEARPTMAFVDRSSPSAFCLLRLLLLRSAGTCAGRPRLTLTLIILCLHITYTISKMMRLFAFFALIASASAFVPPQQAGKLK